MEYRTRTTFTVNAELDILREIKEICENERKSLSEKINELFIGELEKKVVGSQNPLNVSYGIEEKKPSVSQCDIRQWLPRDAAMKMARSMHMDDKQWQHLGDTCHIIARKVRTGYL